MQHEYALLEYKDKKEICTQIFQAVDNPSIRNISVLPFYVNLINKYLPDTVSISSPVDFPLGVSSIKVRNHAVGSTSKLGLHFIDLVINFNYLAQKDYKNLEKDINSNLAICNDNGTKLRIMYEYRQFPSELIDVAHLLENCGIEYFLPSTGWAIDNSYDNILAAFVLRKNNNLTKVILNGNIWTQEHYDNCVKFQPEIIRLHYLSNLSLIPVYK